MKRTLVAVAALIKKNNKYLLAQRKKDDSYPSLWEFPGGALEAGEKIEAAIEREIYEELGAAVKAGWVLGIFFDKNKHLKIKIFLVSCQIKKAIFKKKDCQDFGFFSLEQAANLSLAPADKKILDYLKRNNASKTP